MEHPIVITNKNKVKRITVGTVRPSLPYQGIARRALKPSRPMKIFDDDFVIINSNNTITRKLDWNKNPFVKGANIQFIVAPTKYQHYIICKMKKYGR